MWYRVCQCQKSGIFTVHKHIYIVPKNRLHEPTKWRFFKCLVPIKNQLSSLAPIFIKDSAKKN